MNSDRELTKDLQITTIYLKNFDFLRRSPAHQKDRFLVSFSISILLKFFLNVPYTQNLKKELRPNNIRPMSSQKINSNI